MKLRNTAIALGVAAAAAAGLSLLKVNKDFVVGWVENGASVIGGCCRTTTDHIKEIKKIVEKI